MDSAPLGAIALRVPDPKSALQSAASGPSLQETKLRKAAHDFEALLLHSWWRSMQQSFSETTEEGQSALHNDLSLQAMASAIAERGGLGLADMLLRQFEKPAGMPGNKDVTVYQGVRPLSGGS